MTYLLRWTGLGKLVSFYKYFAFNAPWTTTAAGVVILGGIAAIRVYLLSAGVQRPVYLIVYYGLVVGVALLAAACAVIAASHAVTRLGWALGSLVSVSSLVVYVVGRTAGLPGLPELVGRWGYALGTFSMLLAAAFLGLHFSVVTGMNIAVPQRRQWHS